MVSLASPADDERQRRSRNQEGIAAPVAPELLQEFEHLNPSR
jgi:hypothetical protein